jgi:hypothetical protein
MSERSERTLFEIAVAPSPSLETMLSGSGDVDEGTLLDGLFEDERVDASGWDALSRLLLSSYFATGKRLIINQSS